MIACSPRDILSHTAKSLFLILFISLLTPYIAESQSNNWERKVQLKSQKFGTDFDYIGLNQLAEILKTNTYYSDKIRKAILYLGEERITVTAFNPFVLIGRQMRQMPVPTKYEKNDIQLPVKYFIPIVKEVLGGDLDTSPPQVSDNRTIPINIEGVSIDDKANGTLIRVRTLAKFDKKSLSTRYTRRWLYIDILGGSLDPDAFVTLNNSKLIKKVVPVQMTQMVQLSFQMGKDIATDDVRFIDRDKELWISIPQTEGMSADVIEKLKMDQEKWRIDTIVIDPGHGGRDPGTIGFSGTYEKDVVLAVSKRLRKLLEDQLDLEVLMTRDSDKYISLKERTQFANKSRGKLFVSIHANWNRNAKVSGSTTYFLGLAKSEEALEIAQRENDVIKFDEGNESGKLSEEQIILATMAQNSYNKESQDLAAIIQDELGSRTSLRNRGVKQAGFYVMVGASMPNVLVETAFMSNKRDERWLNSATYQQKIAQAIFNSIRKFKEKYEWHATNGG